VADSLALDPEARVLLLGNRAPHRADKARLLEERARNLDLDQFAAISDWYHYAILSLLELPESRLEARWVAERLNLGQAQAKLAIERLKRLGLVEKRGARWRQSDQPLRVPNSVSTPATRKFHRQLLEKAAESLENDPAESRDFTSMTFALDPRHIPLAKGRIRAFRRELTQELEELGAPKAVYQLTVQLFPVTRAESKIQENKK
jgi:uncharacterized protein (TIGR02147 family)